MPFFQIELVRNPLMQRKFFRDVCDTEFIN